MTDSRQRQKRASNVKVDCDQPQLANRLPGTPFRFFVHDPLRSGGQGVAATLFADQSTCTPPERTGGTFAFAISGALAGVRRRLDVFGVLVLSFVASSFGGIGRDLLIGATPPAALDDWRYLVVSVGAGLITFFWWPIIEMLQTPVRLLDALGLAFFAVAGAEKALAFGLNPVMAVLLGMLTGVGGGMVRDILLAEIPGVLRSDLYAVAALLGAAIVVGGHILHLPVVLTAVIGGLACFVLRMIAIRRGWGLPVANTRR